MAYRMNENHKILWNGKGQEPRLLPVVYSDDVQMIGGSTGSETSLRRKVQR